MKEKRLSQIVNQNEISGLMKQEIKQNDEKNQMSVTFGFDQFMSPDEMDSPSPPMYNNEQDILENDDGNEKGSQD